MFNIGKLPKKKMKIGRMLRAFLIQSDLSVENGLFRLEPRSSFLTQSNEGFFDSTFFH